MTRRPYRLLVVAGAFALFAACSGTQSASTRPGTPGLTPTTTHDSRGSTHSRTPPQPTRVRVEVTPWRLPEAVGREAAVRIGREVVVAGGLVAGDQSTATAFRLDLSTGHVSTLPSLPVPVHDVGGAVLHGRAVVVGGGNAVEQRVVQAEQSDGTWRVVGQLPSARSDLVSVTVGPRAFVVGGYDGTSIAQDDVLVTTDGVHFKVFSRLDLGVRYAAVAQLGGSLWVLGGERGGVEQDAVQRIDLRTGATQIIGQLPHALGHASAVQVGNRLLLIGGRTSGSTLTNAMWWFDPSTQRFTPAGSLPTPLSDAAVVSDGSDIYLIGGENPTVSDHVLRLVPTAG